jgi:hypothetical protein
VGKVDTKGMGMMGNGKQVTLWGKVMDIEMGQRTEKVHMATWVRAHMEKVALAGMEIEEVVHDMLRKGKLDWNIFVLENCTVVVVCTLGYLDAGKVEDKWIEESGKSQSVGLEYVLVATSIGMANANAELVHLRSLAQNTKLHDATVRLVRGALAMLDNMGCQHLLDTKWRRSMDIEESSSRVENNVFYFCFFLCGLWLVFPASVEPESSRTT